MREIKFRAWDRKGKYMGRTFSLADAAYEGFHRPLVDDNGECDTHADYVLMQFTGLKDKNGKEIYEGDVIKTEYGATGICKWSGEKMGFNFNCGEPMWSHPIFGMSGIKEVIGNIYENPDLLDK